MEPEQDQRHAILDDNWERIKDLLPGRPGQTGWLAANNRLFIVPGGGHLFMLYSIDKVVPVVRGFLDSEVPLAA